MQLDTLKSLKEGSQLHLKSARQAAYGLDVDHVTFIRLQERKGYKIPFVVCRTTATGEFSNGKPFGFFKPSDFGFNADDYTIEDHQGCRRMIWKHPLKNNP